MKANPNVEILQARPRARHRLRVRVAGRDRARAGLFPELDRQPILFTPNFAPREEYERGSSRASGSRSTTSTRCATGRSLQGPRPLPPDRHGAGQRAPRARPHGRRALEVRRAAVRDRRARRARAKAGARIVGLHAHTGSGVLDPGRWLDTGRQLLRPLERFPDVRQVDVGGGLGVPEKPGQARLDLRALDAVLARVKKRPRRPRSSGSSRAATSSRRPACCSRA